MRRPAEIWPDGPFDHDGFCCSWVVRACSTPTRRPLWLCSSGLPLQNVYSRNSGSLTSITKILEFSANSSRLQVCFTHTAPTQVQDAQIKRETKPHWSRRFRGCCWCKNFTTGDEEMLSDSCHSRSTMTPLCTDIILNTTRLLLRCTKYYRKPSKEQLRCSFCFIKAELSCCQTDLKSFTSLTVVELNIYCCCNMKEKINRKKYWIWSAW